MLVNGFIGNDDVSYNTAYPYFHTELLISCGRRLIKVEHKMREKVYEYVIRYVNQSFSIFYAYEVSVPPDYTGDKKNIATQKLLRNIKGELKDIIEVNDDANHFTSINIDNQDKKVIRMLTNFNFAFSKESRIYCNNLYYNCKILSNGFESVTSMNWLKTLIEKIERSQEDLEKYYWWFSLAFILAKFYSDGYRRVRAIVPYVSYREIKVVSDSHSSFYIQCSLTSGKKQVAIKYNAESILSNHIVDAVHAYLSHLKNFEDIYSGEIDLTHIFKVGPKIFINNHFIKSKYLDYFRYSLIIDMYNYRKSKSYCYNLFVVCIHNEIDILATALDGANQSHKINTLQIIFPHNKAKEYKLLKNKNFYDKLHMKKTIEEIIRKSIIIIKLKEKPSAFIIPKE